MAYDKVVDSSVLDAGLKQIADAIRAKGGTSDNLVFPQAMADAISAIEAGGEISFTNGKIVPSENTAMIEITHNLGVAPDLLICTTCGIGATSGCVSYAMLIDGKMFQQGSTTDHLYYIKGGSSSSRFTVAADNIVFSYVLTTDTATIDLSGHPSTEFFAGKYYYWYAFAGVTQGVVY